MKYTASVLPKLSASIFRSSDSLMKLLSIITVSAYFNFSYYDKFTISFRKFISVFTTVFISVSFLFTVFYQYSLNLLTENVVINTGLIFLIITLQNNTVKLVVSTLDFININHVSD